MTIDERIEKLTERHEALAQSVEILNHTVETLSEPVDKLNHILRENSERTDSKILALLALAGIHQKRLDGLGGGRAQARSQDDASPNCTPAGRRSLNTLLYGSG